MSDAFRRIERHLDTDAGEIRSLPQLRRCLQVALEVEHTTIPPYLTALWSIRPGVNTEAASAIRNVAMEEMLHMMLVANVLIALGGTPRLTGRRFVPRYPCRLPHAAPGLHIGLRKFSPDTVQDFMRIEHPAPANARPKDEGYHTIGQFYRSLVKAIRTPPVRGEVVRYWQRNPSEATFPRQVGPHEFYGSGGRALFVKDLASALDALREIMHQGEGFVQRRGGDRIGDGDMRAYGEPWHAAHYYRFEQLVLGRAYRPGDKPGKPGGPLVPLDWEAVQNTVSNPRLATFRRAGSLAVPKLEQFNLAYHDMLAALEARFGGDPAGLRRSVVQMHTLGNLAVELMNIPSGFRDGTMAAPTFEAPR